MYILQLYFQRRFDYKFSIAVCSDKIKPEYSILELHPFCLAYLTSAHLSIFDCSCPISNLEIDHLIIKLTFVMDRSKLSGRARARAAPHAKQSQGGRSQQSNEIDSRLYQKFVKFLSRTRLQKLKEKITLFYGRNYPIAYQDKYNFCEEWQGVEKTEEKNLYQLIQSQNVIVRLVCLLVMLTNALIVWFLTVERVFRGDTEESPFFSLMMAIGVANRVTAGAINLYLEYINTEAALPAKLVTRIVIRKALGVAFFAGCFCHSIYKNPAFFIGELILEGQLYLQARRYYKYFRVIELSLVYEYQFKILDLMVNLLILTHFISILLYLGALFDESCNWLLSYGAVHQNYLGKYLLSVYFCSTTILTIGYGDITPKNKLEIIIIIIVQFFGVIIFGYLINEIGHTLSVIRTNEENLQKDLTTLKKIENFYNLQGRLCNRAKGYLVAHQNAVVELTPDEQSTLLAKLNEDLRSTITHEGSLSIVKSSIFFLCRWSKQMQTQVASRLHRALYAPNERLLQPIGKERIYIIKRGKVDIYCDRFGQNRKEYRRLLKTIKVQQDSSISENIYGYTAVISLRPSALDAVSSEFTSCFFLDKEAFLKCVNSCEVDLEYYHEIKSRIDQSEFCEAYEAPSILNVREHYNPSRTVLIRKTRAQRNRLFNQRSTYVRRERRNNQKTFFRDMAKIIEDINDKLIYGSIDLEEATNFRDTPDEVIDSRLKGSEKQIQEELTRGLTSRKKTATIIRTNEIINLNSLNSEKTQIFAPIIRKAFHHYFQRAQEYKNFFCNNNLAEVLRSLSKQNYNFNKKECDFLSVKMYVTQSSINFGFKNNNHL